MLRANILQKSGTGSGRMEVRDSWGKKYAFADSWEESVYNTSWRLRWLTEEPDRLTDVRLQKWPNVDWSMFMEDK